MWTQRIVWTALMLALLIASATVYELARFVDHFPALGHTAPSSAPQTEAAKERIGAIEFPKLLSSAPLPPGKMSAAVGKLLQSALNAAKQSNYVLAKSLLAQIDALPNKTPFELYKINEVWAFLYGRERNYRAMLEKYEQLLANPEVVRYASPKQRATIPKTMVQLATATKQFDKAIYYGEIWLGGHLDDAEMHVLVANAYYEANDFQGCLKNAGDAIALAVSSGAKPTEAWLKFERFCAAQQLNSAVEQSSLALLCRYYPKSDYWQRYIQLASRDSRSDLSEFYLKRLAFEVGTMRVAYEYIEFARRAIADFNLPTTAASALNQGIANRAFDGIGSSQRSRAQELLQRADELANAATARIPTLAEQAKLDSTGQANFELGLIYLDQGRYALAVQSLDEALNKGQLSDPNQATISLAIAQLKNGDPKAARDTFALLGTDPALKSLADAWIVRTYN